MTYYIQTSQADLGITLTGFSVDESYTIISAAYDLANAMGGSEEFRRNLGGVSIIKKDLVGRRNGEAVAHSVWLDPDLFTNAPAKNSGNPRWTVVHELVHAWDGANGWELSRQFERDTGGHTNILEGFVRRSFGGCPSESLPGCNDRGYFYGDIPPKGSGRAFTREEDFAESATAYVYPQVATARDHDLYGQSSPLYYSTYETTKRWQPIDQLMNTP